MNTIQTDGIFIQALKWSMPDENTGEIRTGCKLRIAVPVDGTEYNPTKGFVINEYSADANLFEKVAQAMAGKPVVMEMELRQKGKNLKLVPLSIELTK